MRKIEDAQIGKVCMDERARYNNSIKGFESEKRSLRMTDLEEMKYQAARAEMRKKLRAERKARGLL